MPLIQTQLDSELKKQGINRPSTSYEFQTYKNSSLQDVANIGKFYNTLNKDNSLVDYLKYNGIDPNSRGALAQQKGISNIGTAEGNTALLNALKGGTTPTTPNAQQGTIPTASTSVQTPPQTTEAPQTNDTQPTGQSTQGSVSGATTAPSSVDTVTTPTNQDSSQGSISSAAASQYTPDEGLNQAKTSYQNVQSQIESIDNALRNELAAKKQQVIQSGGIVNEAQLMGEVNAEKSPLLAQRNALVSQQSSLGRLYQSALQADKAARTEFDKNNALAEKKRVDDANIAAKTGSLSLAQQREADVNTRFAQSEGGKNTRFAQTEKDKAATQALNEQKLYQSGLKVVKTSSIDSYGNKVGDNVQVIDVNTGRPINMTAGSPQSKAINQIATSGTIGSPTTKSQAVVSSFTSPSYVSKFASIADAPTDENQGIKVPGTHLTVSALYGSALDWMSKPITVARKMNADSAAIANKGGAILQSLGIGKNEYEASYKANSAALANQMKLYGQLSVNEKAAQTNFKTLITLSTKLDETTYRASSPIIEKWVQSGQISLSGDANVNNFVSQLTLAMTEYAKVITGQTGGSAVSDSARTEMEKLLNSGLSTETIKSYITNVATPDINGRVNAQKDTIQGFMSGLKTGTPGVDSSTTPTNIDPIAPTSIPDGYYQASDGLLYKK